MSKDPRRTARPPSSPNLVILTVATSIGMISVWGSILCFWDAAVLINQEYLHWFPVHGRRSFGATSISAMIWGEQIPIGIFTGAAGLFLLWFVGRSFFRRLGQSPLNSPDDQNNPYSAPSAGQLQDKSLNAPPEKGSGFLIPAMLIGIGAGYAPADIYAGLNGYQGLGRYHLNQTLIAMVTGGVLGLALGILLDAKLRSPRRRSSVLNWMWVLLVFGYLLFQIIRPALQSAR
jgi:hypothetical protein